MQAFALQAIDSIPIALLILNSEAKMIYANKVASEIWGEVKYKDPTDLAVYEAWDISGKPIKNPEDWAAIKALRSGKTVLNQELRIKTFRGEEKVILNSAIPIKNDQGEITHCVIVNQDITLLRNSEQQLEKSVAELSQQVQQVAMFKQAVDQAAEHIIITDPDGTVVYANNSVELVTGYNKKEVIGTKAGTLWSKPMSQEFYHRLWDTIKTHKQIFHGEITNRKKSGEEYIALTTITPILDANNEIQYFMAFERDISRQKEIDQAKTEFVSFASHQLRTPLTAVKWYTEMLLEGDAGKVSEQQAQFLEEISDGTERMVQLVSALLNVSRIEMGTFQIHPQPIDVIASVTSLINELKPQYTAKNMHIKLETEEIPHSKLDENLLSIIFHNLITNAVKYSHSHSTVRISLKHTGGKTTFGKRTVPEHSIVCSVQDHGIGITEHQQDQIFTKLFRADNAMMHDTTGTGLGLYITKSIITTVGGQIWFESKEKKGTTFYFWIPDTISPRMSSKQLEIAHE